MPRPPASLARHLASRPTAIVVFVALLLGSAACLAVGIAFPLSAEAPVRFGAVLLVVALGLAAANWTWHERITDAHLLAQVAAVIVLQSALVAAAHKPAGVIVDATGFAWIVAYVAAMFPRWAIPYGVLASTGLAVGTAVGGVGGLTSAIAVLVVTILGVAAACGAGSRVVRRHLRTDPLTGALNRAGLADAVDRVRRRGSAALAVLDLDDFKTVNDAHGHLAGDKLLAEASAAWHGVLRRDDLLARTGGDEFVVVLPETSPQDALAILGRLASAHAAPFSAGLSCTRPWEPFDAAVGRADRDLYRVKATRRAAAERALSTAAAARS